MARGSRFDETGAIVAAIVAAGLSRDALMQATQRSGLLVAGGVLLVVLGSLLAIVMIVAVLVEQEAGETEDTIVGLLFVLVGAAQVWAGIDSIRGQRRGKILGIVLSSIGIAVSLLYLLASFTAEEVSIDAATFEIVSEPRVNAGGVAISLIGFLGYVTALVLLSVGRPLPHTAAGATVRVLDAQGEAIGNGVVTDRALGGELVVEVHHTLLDKATAVEDTQGRIRTARFDAAEASPTD